LDRRSQLVSSRGLTPPWWRRGLSQGLGWPLAGLGLGLGYYGYPYYSSYYSDPCIVWDGYDWVNIWASRKIPLAKSLRI
jgi:hypothetical protein